jgi:hypothetical protein
LALVQLGYVLAFTHNQPWNDEWEFIPTLCGHESVTKYLWAQHNEHRMPLPRGLWLALFERTHDFRTGSILQVALNTALAFACIRWAGALRGRPSWCDLFFPLSLLHLGHAENLLMGYQICFSLACLGVVGLARLAMRATVENRLRTALLASLLSAMLAVCGGFGAVFSLPAMVWIWYLALTPLSLNGRGVVAEGARLGILVLSLFPIVYLRFYFQDYHRPEGHPPFEWKNWYAAVQVTMEVLAVGFGIGVEWVWLAVFLGILAASGYVALEGFRRFRTVPSERQRVAGWVAVCVGVCGLALAIGAGRSGFGREFGLASRYSILTWPLLAVAYLAAVAWDGPKLKWIPTAFMLGSLALFPVNTMYGVTRGWYHDQWLGTIETMLKDGEPDARIVRELIEETGQGERALRGIPMLRERRVGPFARE